VEFQKNKKNLLLKVNLVDKTNKQLLLVSDFEVSNTFFLFSVSDIPV